MTKRIAFTAHIRPGEREKLERQLAAGPPFDPERAGFTRHSVFAGDSDVVFLFEGADPLPAIHRLAAQPGLLGDVLKMAGALSTPHLMTEVYTWTSEDREAALTD